MNREDAIEAKNAPLFVGRYENGKKISGIEEAVEYLQECKRKGQNVYVDFNGHKLYSADVTLDSAYMEVVGMTKAEDEAIREEYIQAETEEEKEAIIAKWGSVKKAHQEEAKKSATPAEKTYLGNIENAVAYLQECKKNGQNVYVDFNENKLYSEDVTLESAYMQVTGMTKEEFEGIRGELLEAETEEEKEVVIAKGEEIKRRHQEEAKKSATPAEKTYLGNIENAVAYLQECKKNGQNVYVDFNGHKLYSADVTLDSAYMEVVGMTKAEDEAIRAEYSQAKTEEEKEAIIAKWDSIRKAHAEAGDKKGNKTLLDSAIEATEETTKTSTINGQAQGIKDVSKRKDENVQETEIVE